MGKMMKEKNIPSF